jgi:phospholipid transport system substrate-binding protein
VSNGASALSLQFNLDDHADALVVQPRRTPLRALLALLAALLVVCPFASADETPADVVERLHAALLEAMQNGAKLGYEGRVDLLEPVINESFDFRTIASIVTGREWKSADTTQRSTFLDVFARLSVATYATNFSSYSGEKFITGTSEESRGAQIVRTMLEQSDGDRVSLNYMLRESHGKWRIINVVAQGVSDLSLKRAEYTAVIQSEGFDSLSERLHGKLRELERENAAAAPAP